MAAVNGWTLTLLLLGLALLLLVVFLREVNAYWRKLGVAFVQPTLLFGNAASLFFMREGFSTLIDNIYRRLDGCSVGGFYLMTQPYLLLRDPEVIKRVNLWDEKHFRCSALPLRYYDFRPVGHEAPHDGAGYAEVRRRIAAILGPERTRRTFCLLEGCVQRVLERLAAACRATPGPVQLRPHALFAGFSTDVIGRCAFGVECGAIDDPTSQFLRIGMEVSRPCRWQSLLSCLWPLFRPLLPLLSRCSPAFEGRQLFHRLFHETVLYRKRHGIHCEDFIELLLQIKNGEVVAPCVRSTMSDATVDETLACRLLELFVVGSEMTAAVLSFCAFELAANQAAQTRARLEVDAALRPHGGRITYDALQRMPYLDAVLTETLRLYPPLGATCRQVVAPYRVPVAGPGPALRLRRGDCVCVPVAPLHRDAAHYPRPHRFLPERFLGGPAQARHSGSGDGRFLALGWGPRPCVGRHFAVVEMKAVMAALLSHFELHPNLRSGDRPANPDGGGRDLWVRVTPRIWYTQD